MFRQLLSVTVLALMLIAVSARTSQHGRCGWYSLPEGAITASGERFNSQALTAAHATLPFGTVVQVQNGFRYVDVRINDRVASTNEKILYFTKGTSQNLQFEESYDECTVYID